VMKNRLEISDAGFEGVKAYAYKGGDYTPLDNFLNANLWTPAAKLLPTWMAPNLITLVGLTTVILSFFLLVSYCPNFQGSAPAWVYFFVGFCVFFYQTMDAMDGKQARATNSASPLGQLFDHGCDSVSSTFLTLGVCTSMNLGVSLETMLFLFSVQLPFFIAQWQEYHTHIMVHAMGWVGVTEAQFFTISIHLLSGLFGPQLFQLQLGPIKLNQLIVLVQIGLGLFVSFNACKTVFSTPKVNKQTAVLQIAPLMGVIFIGLLWAAYVNDVSMNNVYRRHALTTSFLLGILFTHLSNQIIVCALCRMPYPTQWILLPLPFLFLAEYFGLLGSEADVVFGIYAGGAFLRIGQFIFNFIEEITNFLGIYCLTLGPRKEPASLKGR